MSRPITQDPSQLRDQAAATATAAILADAAANQPVISERLDIGEDVDAASDPIPAGLAAPSMPAGTATSSERPLTAGPTARMQPALQDGVMPCGMGTSGIPQDTAAQSGLQSAAEADPAPWRARAAWLQAQTMGDPAAELYRSKIPLGRAAGMGGMGPDSSAYQESYGKDPAALAKSTAKEAVARKAQVSPDHLATKLHLLVSDGCMWL